MFSQFRNAVEHLAQQQQQQTIRRPASNSISSQSNTQFAQASGDTCSPTSSLQEGHSSLSTATPSQLAESALFNFKKTLISSRSSSPGPPQIPDKDSSKHIRSLEDRLRASFALGDASERTTPDTSKLPSPSEVDPTAVALPLSPERETYIPSFEETFDPLGAQTSPDLAQNVLSPPPLAMDVDQYSSSPLPHGRSEAVHQSTRVIDSQGAPSPPSLPQPLHESPHVALDEPDQLTTEASPPVVPMPQPPLFDPTVSRAASRPSTPDPLSLFSMEDREPDVEKLRERLKLVEQRFVGKHSLVSSDVPLMLGRCFDLIQAVAG